GRNGRPADRNLLARDDRIDVETLITAFLFSEVMIDGLESTLSRSSDANVLSAAKNRSLLKVKKLRPASVVTAVDGGKPNDGRPWSTPAAFVPRPGALETVPPGANLLDRRAHSMPSRVSPVSVTSATMTSISTWRGLRSSCLSVCSKSVQ